LAYIRAFRTSTFPELGWLAGSFVLFVASLLFHAVAVSVPALLLILDVCPLRRFGEGGGKLFAPTVRTICYEKAPFVIASLLFIVLAIAARRQSLVSVEQSVPSASLAHACYGIWFYIPKTLLPMDLAPVYPSPKAIDWFPPPFRSSIAGVIAMSVCSFLLRGRWPALLAAWLSYLVILVPNSGVVRFSEQIAADRYSYMAMLGWTVVLAGCFCRLWRAPVRPVALGTIALAVASVVGLIPMNWYQCRTWRDSETLWTHALNHGGAKSSVAHYNLALVLFRQGKLEASASHDAEALRLSPADFTVHNNLGVVLQRQGKLEASTSRYVEALRLNPDYLDAHYNLGIVLSRQGKFAKAAVHYAEALRLDPSFASAHHNLGVDCFRQGRLALAEEHYIQALRLDPGRIDTHTNLGVLLAQEGKFEEAVAHYTEALRLNPDYTEARKNLELDRARHRKAGEATAHSKDAKPLNGDKP
jgi:protein O-mannosyl-transferase